MSRFVAILLQEALQFGEEHLAEIRAKIQTNQSSGFDNEGSFHDENIAMITRTEAYENTGQPFLFSDDRYCLVFNGQLYNEDQLRERLKRVGYTFEVE